MGSGTHCSKIDGFLGTHANGALTNTHLYPSLSLHSGSNSLSGFWGRHDIELRLVIRNNNGISSLIVEWQATFTKLYVLEY